MGTTAWSFVGLLTLCLVLTLCASDESEECEQHFGSNVKPLPPDNRFEIEVVDVIEMMYIPQKTYSIRLFSRDGQTPFIAYNIFLVPDQKPHEKNHLRTSNLDPGKLLKYEDGKETEVLCLFESDKQPKTSVQARWVAPPKGNKCVTFKAKLAIQLDLWYEAESPLVKKVCENERKADDIPPKMNHNCSVCEEARYKLTFEGKWSINTHLNMYPNGSDQVRFSDIVGASHSYDYSVFKEKSYAAPGLEMMAEQGNTTDLELAILEKLKDGNVRTLIKATAPPKTDMSTVTSFRVNNKMHFVSIVTSIIPSPDWFLGVDSLEVCDADSGTWAESVNLNLYPFDAGTDSGKYFESPNEATMPHQPITIADINRVDRKEWKPFAILKVELVRTYFTPDCLTSTVVPSTDGPPGPDIPEPPTTESKTSSTEEPAEPDNKCDMTEWSEWSPCEGECVDNLLIGYRHRSRTFKDKDCLDEKPIEADFCEEPCEELTTTTEVPEPLDEEAEKRIRWRQQLKSTSLN